MKNILVFILAGLFMLFSTSAYSQTDTSEIKDFQVGFVPHYAFFHGIRFDIERKIPNKDSYLQFTPHFYFNEQTIDYENISVTRQADYEKISGLGLGLYHKMIVYKSPRNIVYLHFAYGGEYSYLEMSYKTYEWMEYYENNLEYYRYGLAEHNEPINRLKLNLSVGIQINIAQSLYVGSYLGSGFSYSFTDIDIGKFTTDMTDYAYSGVYIPLGFRIGVMF